MLCDLLYMYMVHFVKKILTNGRLLFESLLTAHVQWNKMAKLCQWYQSTEYVTASLKLSKSKKGVITAKFTEKECSVYDGGMISHNLKPENTHDRH